MSKRKKIIYVITKSNWGGAQRYVYDLATHLPPDRYEVIVAGGGNGPLFEKLQEKDIWTIKIPNLDRDINPIKDILSFWTLLKIFVREKPDIVHLNSTKIGITGSFAAFISKPLTYNLKPKTVFTVHGWAFKEERGWLAKKVIFILSWLSSMFQDKIILICHADFISAQKFLPRRKIKLIHNGIEEIKFYSKGESQNYFAKLTDQKIEPSAKILGTIAELTPNKGLIYLIESMYLLKKENPGLKIKLFIIGEGEQRAELKNKIKKLKLEKTVFLLGFIPEAEKYLKGFDVFILSSLKEGLPYALLEAMLSEIPVVATKVGGIQDLIIDQKEGFLVEPRNSLALVKTLEHIISYPEKNADLAKNAKEKIEQNFGLEKMLSKTLALYD